MVIQKIRWAMALFVWPSYVQYYRCAAYCRCSMTPSGQSAYAHLNAYIIITTPRKKQVMIYGWEIQTCLLLAAIFLFSPHSLLNYTYYNTASDDWRNNRRCNAVMIQQMAKSVQFTVTQRPYPWTRPVSGLCLPHCHSNNTRTSTSESLNYYG